jgi:chemotaxis protein MotB
MKSVDTAEIVIVRRPSILDDEGHYGGVWKIAFADFMTAMMAFFLVMWLINATDDETRAGIASYFNPVKLASATVDKKGLRDPLETEKEGTPEGKQHRSAVESDEDSLKGYSRTRNDTHERQPSFSESALFEDPYAVLAALVSGSEPKSSDDASSGAFETLGQQGKPGLNGGDAQRDPFDPVYWRMSKTPLPNDGPESGGAEHNATEPGTPVPPVQTTEEIAPEDLNKPAADKIAAAPAVPPGTEKTEAAAAEAEPATEPPAKIAATATEPFKDAKPLLPGEKPDDKSADAAAKAPEPVTPPSEKTDPVAESLTPKEIAAKLEEKIAAAIADLEPAPGVEVTSTSEGLLVSIMDDSDFGMFAIGSAEPQPELIRAVDKISAVLAEREGPIVIRGHTDGRPFRSKTYDNWRLSSARAHMAYYMLVRGGLPENRFERIEGHADQKLKIISDPEAPQNRRVEILIREKTAR